MTTQTIEQFPDGVEPSKISKTETPTDKLTELQENIEFDPILNAMDKEIGSEATNYYYETIFPETTGLANDLKTASNTKDPEAMGETFKDYAGYMAKLDKQLKKDLPNLSKKQKQFILQLTMEASGYYEFQADLAKLDKETQKNFLLYLIPFYGSYLDWTEGRKIMAVIFLGLDTLGIIGAVFSGGGTLAVEAAAKTATQAAVKGAAKAAAKETAKATVKGVTKGAAKVVGREGIAKGITKSTKFLKVTKAETVAEGLRLFADLSAEGSRLSKSFAKAGNIVEANKKWTEGGLKLANYMRKRTATQKEKSATATSKLLDKSTRLATP